MSNSAAKREVWVVTWRDGTFISWPTEQEARECASDLAQCEPFTERYIPATALDVARVESAAASRADGIANTREILLYLIDCCEQTPSAHVPQRLLQAMLPDPLGWVSGCRAAAKAGRGGEKT